MNPTEEYVLDDQDSTELATAGKWAQFIGIVFIILGGITCLTFVFLLWKDDAIARKLMKINHLSEQSVNVIMTGGKVIFGGAMAVAVTVMFLVAFWLIKFHQAIKAFTLHHSEHELNQTFDYLSKYFKITFVLGCFYLFVSVLGILFSLSI